MTEAVDPDRMSPNRRRPSLDRLDVVCLAWAGLFAVVTTVLALVLR